MKATIQRFKIILLKEKLYSRNSTPPKVDRILMVLLEKWDLDVNGAPRLKYPMRFAEKGAIVFKML